MKVAFKYMAPVLACGLLGAAVSGQVMAAPSNLSASAKVSMDEARRIALKAYPGKIVKEELEREKGGSGLRYSFDMRQGNKWREVGVDAKTGHLLENVAEGANPKD